jgi:hypothetical protein
MERTWERVVSMVCQVLAASVEGVGVAQVRHPYRLLEWGVALNVASKFGEGFDLEIGDSQGFASAGLFDPESEGVVDFTPPRVGDWIKILNCRVSNEVDAYGKKKIRVPSAWQLRVISKQSAKLSDGSAKGGRRGRRGV